MSSNNFGSHNEAENSEKVVHVSRCTKVVKGGRRFTFSVIAVVGDGKGRVGVGLGKAVEVLDAKHKAIYNAKRKMFKVSLRDGRTLHHDVEARFGAGKIKMRSALPGTGIIAGGPVRAVFEVLGIKDVVAKSLGSSNPHNMVKAALRALIMVKHPRHVAERRGKKVSEIVGTAV